MDWLDRLSGIKTANPSIMEWVWNYQHPILYTIIQVFHNPYYIALIAILGYNIIKRMFGKSR